MVQTSIQLPLKQQRLHAMFHQAQITVLDLQLQHNTQRGHSGVKCNSAEAKSGAFVTPRGKSPNFFKNESFIGELLNCETISMTNPKPELSWKFCKIEAIHYVTGEVFKCGCTHTCVHVTGIRAGSCLKL